MPGINIEYAKTGKDFSRDWPTKSQRELFARRLSISEIMFKQLKDVIWNIFLIILPEYIA